MSNFHLMFLTLSLNLPAWLSVVVTPGLQHSPWNTFMYTKCNLSSPPPPITIFNISIHISEFPDLGIMFVCFPWISLESTDLIWAHHLLYPSDCKGNHLAINITEWLSICFHFLRAIQQDKLSCFKLSKCKEQDSVVKQTTHLWKTVCVSVTQSCPTLCDPMDCSLAGSSVHGIFQARILEWVALLSSRGSSPPRDQTQVSCTAGRWLYLSHQGSPCNL